MADETPSPSQPGEEGPLRLGHAATSRGAGSNRAGVGRLALSRRTIQIALGCLWLLDGLLKFQPDLWHSGFVNTVISPNAQGQPLPLSWVITHTASLLLHGQAAWVISFGLIEIAIGLGLLFSRSVRTALIASFVWATLIWVFGEGFGGVLTGHVSPLMGAPGTSYLYALVGVLVWPTEPEAGPKGEGMVSSAIGSGRFGLAGGLGGWCGVWFFQAILWLFPFNRQAASVQSQVSGMAQGEPTWYGHLLSALGHNLGGSGLVLSLIFAGLSLLIAAGPLVSRRGEIFLVLGMAIALLYCATGEAFGQVLTLGGTDPSNGVPLVLLGLGLLPTIPAEDSTRSLAASWFARHRVVSTLTASSAATLVTAVALLPASAPAASASSNGQPPTTAQQEAGMAPGQPLRDPTDLNVSTPPVLNLRLAAEYTRFDISGKTVWGESYDGDYVGPTMHFVPGETVNLTLVNKLATATNLHFHGMHISPSGAGDNPYLSVQPGRSFNYHFTIPLDQPIGTFWYHDHDMCMGSETMAMPGMKASPKSTTNCQDIESQIYDGLSGTIIVGNDRTLMSPDLQHVTTKTLAIKDMQITPSNHIVANAGSYSIDSGNPTVRLVNGQLRPTLTMRPGETELWQLANEGADLFYNLALPGYSFTIVGQDGYPVTETSTANTLSLPPAKRWDVLVTAPSQASTSWLETLPIDNGPQGDTYPGVNLMRVRVAGPSEQSLPAPTGGISTAIPSLANAPIAQHRTVTFSESSDGTVMYVNGKQFNPDQSVFSTPAVLGTTEQWTVENTSGEVHVFHSHTDHFQVTSINGVPQPYTGEQDIVDVPYEQNGVPGQVVIRIHFTDFTGRVMFHCHIASHEDAGMMSFINVVDPPPDYDRSLVTP